MLQLILLWVIFPLSAHALHFGFLSGASAFFEPIAEGFGTRCNATGVECSFLITSPIDGCDCDCRREIEVQYLIDLGVDAIAMKPCRNRLPIIDEASALGIPVVTYDTDSPNTTRIANVGTDDGFVGRTMARLLRQLRPEGGVFTIVGDAIDRDIAFEDEVTIYNDRKNKAHWDRLLIPDSIPIESPTVDDFLDFMEIHAVENISAFVILKQTPMRHPNWTEFVDRHRFRNITYIGVDSSDYQLDYLNRKYVDGLVGQLPYEMGTTCFDLLMEYLDNGYLEDDYYPTNVVAYNLIPLELPDLDVDENLVGNLKFVGHVCFGSVVFFSAICVAWTVLNRDHPVVKAAQPFFLFMIAGGVIVLASSIIPLSMEGEGDPEEMSKSYQVGICMSIPWLSFTGLTVTFSALFAKTWRVNRLFHAQGGMNRIKVTVWDVLAPFGALMICNIAVLLCWTIIDPLTYTREFYDGTDYWNREFASYGSCRSKHSAAFLSPLAVVNLSAVAIACWQAFEARSIKGEFAESKYIGLTMFSLFQAFLTGIPVIAVVVDTPQAYYMVLTLMIFLLSMVFLVLIFVPKMLKLKKYVKMSPQDQKRKIQTSVHMSTRSAAQRDPQARNSMDHWLRASGGSVDLSVTTSTEFMAKLPRIYPGSKIKFVVNSATFAIELVNRLMLAFENSYQGRFSSANSWALGVPPLASFDNKGRELTKSCMNAGYLKENPYYVVHASVEGGSSPSDAHHYQVYSQKTGGLECMLFDNGLLSKSTTAAVGALAVKSLGPSLITNIGMIGTGIQARHQLSFLTSTVRCRNLLVYGQNFSTRMDYFMREAESDGFTVKSTSVLHEMLESCEVVFVIGSTSKELVEKPRSSIRMKTRLIVCMGAGADGQQTLDLSLVRSAKTLVADVVDQSVRVGEFKHMVDAGGDPARIQSMGEVLVSKHDQPEASEDPDALTIFDATGTVLQECVVAQVVCDALSNVKTTQFRMSDTSLDSNPSAMFESVVPSSIMATRNSSGDKGKGPTIPEESEES
eukprot:Nitzschia sp. Nitz4//scaffold12_size214221//195993//199055//NITZ4_001537-RA/size214221-processed-gene-0.132-mRNA-1//1//CDS//3329535131//3487//frame0